MVPAKCRRKPLAKRGATISRAEMNCELTSAGSVNSPPCGTQPSTKSGGQPFRSKNVTRAPNVSSASVSGPMGRCFMRSLPVSSVRPGCVA